MIDTQKARKALTENETTVINYLNKHGIDGELTVQTCTRTKFTILRSDGEEITFNLPARLYRAGYSNINAFLAIVRNLIQPPKKRDPSEVSEEEIARYMPGKWSPDYVDAVIAYVKKVKKVGITLYIVSEYDNEAKSTFRGSSDDLIALDKFDGYDRAEESGHPLLVTEDKEKAEKLFAGKHQASTGTEESHISMDSFTANIKSMRRKMKMTPCRKSNVLVRRTRQLKSTCTAATMTQIGMKKAKLLQHSPPTRKPLQNAICLQPVTGKANTTSNKKRIQNA